MTTERLANVTLLKQDHGPGNALAASTKSIKIYPRTEPVRLPYYPILPRLLLDIQKCLHLSAKDIVDTKHHRPGYGDRIADSGRGVEGIRVVGGQGKFIGNSLIINLSG